MEYFLLALLLFGASYTSFIIGRRDGIGYVVNIIGRNKPKFLLELDRMMANELD